jgi:hypothetical protein
MDTLKGISKYIIIVFIWVILAFFVAWIQYDTSDLSASVLSITEQDFFESTKWDAWYKKENQIFEVFLAEQVRNEWILTVSILSSPETQRLVNQLETPYYIDNLQQNEGNITLNISWYESWDFTQWIFQLPYSWDSKELTLEYIKSENLNFAIWNLDNIDSEDQIH